MNSNLHKAKAAKNDEFYTQLSDISNELRHYKKHFEDKVVFLNCDDPKWSNFYVYFAQNFEHLKLKKLIATHYNANESTYKLEITRDENNDGKINALDTIETPLKGNGDFKSPECVELLKEADIVATNPPFSLFREYVAQLIEYDKKFIILGSQGACGYKEIFPLIKEGNMWLGVDNGGTKWFEVPDDYEIATESRKKIVDGVKYFSLGNIAWYTNIEHKKRNEEIILYKNYSPELYSKYDNFDAINIDTYLDIPKDYNGLMGVPITFLDKYNPNQFEIVRHRKGDDGKDLRVAGKDKYHRVIIKRK